MQPVNKFAIKTLFFFLLLFVFGRYNPLLAWENLTGGDHGGADWTINTNISIAGNHTNIGTFTVNNGITATVQAYDGASYGSVQVAANSVNIQGTITAAGKGYTHSTDSGGPGAGEDATPCTGGQAGGGGGHGGRGQDSLTPSSGGKGGITYGSLLGPTTMGSAGGNGEYFGCQTGVSGGGAVKISSATTFALTGTINVNGTNATQQRGGGSGGSVWLISSTYSGSGTISSNGGSATDSGGGGGGGRIAINYSTSYTASYTITATKGRNAEDGTIVLYDSTNNDVIVPTSQTWSANPSVEGPTLTFRNFTLTNTSTLNLRGYYNDDSGGSGITFNVTNFTMDTGTTINGQGLGYGWAIRTLNYKGPGGGGDATPCTGGGGGGGGGHGGAGQQGSANGAAGIANDVFSSPVYLGSMGGKGEYLGCKNGSYGGSAIKISASNSITLNNGNINMSGNNTTVSQTGAGSGGSIFLIGNTISGSGTLSANGGNASGNGGGGGGGLIAIYYASGSAPSVTTSASKGTGTGSTPAAGDGIMLTSGYPTLASSLQQFKSDGTTAISSGGTTNETTVVLKVSMSAGTSMDLTPQFEVRDIGTSFTGTYTHAGSPVSYSGTPVTGSASVTSLTDSTNYHWQARVCETSYGNCSAWVEAGGSPYDFRVFLNQNPNSPSSLGPTSVITGSSISDTTPTFNFSITDPDAGNQVYFQINIASDTNFSVLSVDYTSVSGSQGAQSFTVGQLAGGGIYTIGDSGQALVNGTYYWRVKAFDSTGAESQWVVANSGNSAFNIDSSAPNLNASSLSFTNATSGEWTKLEPAISWVAGSDNGSSLLGYCISLSEDPVADATSSADPAVTAGVLDGLDDGVSSSACPFIVSSTSLDLSSVSGLSLTSNKQYYLSIKAVDEAGNTFGGSSNEFQNLLNFKYDSTPPTNVTSISGAGGSFSNISDMYFSWPTSGNNIASDLHSGLLGYQYSINDQTNWRGTVTDYLTGLSVIPATASSTLYLDQDRDSEYVVVGSNTIYFRTVDVAGNLSSSSTYRTASIAYGGEAPAFAGDAAIIVTPSSATENNFAFSWTAATPADGRTITSYYYMINTQPPATLSTITDNTATYKQTSSTEVPESELTGVVRGSNTVYVVAVDDLENYSPSNYLTASFTLNTENPDAPKNLAISDASIKSASLWRASLAWTVPDYTGLGSVTYTVQRSEDGTTWSTVGQTSGTAYVDTVATSSKYYWRVGTSDSAASSIANPTYSNAVTLTPKGSYTQAADLTSGPAAGSITTKKSKITWTTSRNSDSKIAFGVESGKYQAEEPSNSSQVTDHEINLTNLSPGTKYYYVAKWTDEDGNTGTSSEKTFTTQSAPVIKESSESSVSLDSAIVNFTSINASKVKIYYGKSTEFGGASTIETSTTESSYSLQVTGLDDGTKYYYKLNGFDVEGAEYEGEIHSFETLPRPRVSDIRLQQIADTAETTILVTWKSNTEISSIVTVYPVNQPGLDRDIVDLILINGDHSMIINSLLPATEYSLVVKGRDKLGNEAVSSTLNFTTATDTRPPVIKNVKIVGSATPVTQNTQSTAQLIISWDTDELATSQIEYGEGSGLNYSHKSQLDNNLTTNHVVVLSNLTPSQVYHLRALSADAAGNMGLSGDVVTIAPKAIKSAVDLVINNLTQIFNFNNR